MSLRKSEHPSWNTRHIGRTEQYICFINIINTLKSINALGMGSDIEEIE